MSKRKKRDWFHHNIIHGIDQEGLHSQYIDDTIGRGVYSTQQYWKGDYLLEYRESYVVLNLIHNTLMILLRILPSQQNPSLCR